MTIDVMTPAGAAAAEEEDRERIERLEEQLAAHEPDEDEGGGGGGDDDDDDDDDATLPPVLPRPRPFEQVYDEAVTRLVRARAWEARTKAEHKRAKDEVAVALESLAALRKPGSSNGPQQLPLTRA